MIEHERKGWIDAVTWRISRVAMLLPAIIVVIMMLEVFMRYVLEKPTIWVNELSLWMGGWIYLTAGVYAMQQRSHIRITLLYDIVPRWLRKTFDVLSTSLIVCWGLATIYGASSEAWDALINWERFGTAWDPPIPAVSQPLILVVMTIVCLQAVSNLILDWNDDEDSAVDEDMLSEIDQVKKAQGLIDNKTDNAD